MEKQKGITEINEKEIVKDQSLSFLTDTYKSKYDKYYFCKVRTKKEIHPFFETSREIDGVIQKVNTGLLQRVFGKLNAIEFNEGTYQGQVIKSVVFKLETPTPTGEIIGMRISCSRNAALLNWLNCLVGFDDEVKTFEMSLWKDKVSGYNKSTCKINGVKGKWALTIDEMESKKEKIYDKKGNLITTKSDELYDYFENELKKKLDILLPNRYKDEGFEEKFEPTDGDIDRTGEEFIFDVED